MSTRQPRVERNKNIALQAIQLLERFCAPDITADEMDLLRVEFDALRERWSHVPWVQPQFWGRFDLDDWVTAEEMAKHADVKPGTVRMWHHRGYITGEKHNGRRVYSIREVVNYQNRRRQEA